MKTSGTVKDDILRSIQQYSEVTDLGYDLLQRQSHPDLGTSFKRFQAYLRQGLTFFGAADQTHYRASPLLYYYAFMNLAKAIVFLYDHGFTAGHIYHGLTPAPGTGNFRDHFIKVKTSGVFQSFYHQILGENIATETKLGVLGLLSYISDLAYEHRFFNLGESSSYPCKYAVVQWEGEEQYRGLICGRSGRCVEESSPGDIMEPF